MKKAGQPAGSDSEAIDGGSTDLGGRAVRSGSVQLISQALELLVVTATGMILARLLGPTSFGIFAMVWSLVAFVTSFSDLGLNWAAVSERRLTHLELSALFWFSLRFGAVVLVLLVVAAPLIAKFYGEPQLVPLVMVTSVAVVIRGFGAQHEAVLARQMRFGTFKSVELGATILGSALALALALTGHGVWALVATYAGVSVFRTAGLWLRCPWRPARMEECRESNADVRRLLSYGVRFSAFRAVRFFARQTDRIVIGRVMGAGPLGFYDVAARWSSAITEQLFMPLAGVAVSRLSHLADDPPAFRAAMLRAILPVFTVIAPGLVFAATQAESLLFIILGEGWSPTVPLFQLFCVAALVDCFDRVSRWVYLANGDMKRQLRASLISAPFVAVCVLAGVAGGVRGVAIAFTIATSVSAIGGLFYCLRDHSLRAVDVLALMVRPLIAALTAALACALISTAGQARIPALGIELLVYVVCYAATWVLLPGGRAAATTLMQMLSELTPVRWRVGNTGRSGTGP